MKNPILYLLFLLFLTGSVISCKQNTVYQKKTENETPTSGVVTVVFKNPEKVIPHGPYTAPSVSCFNSYFVDKKWFAEDIEHYNIDVYKSENIVNYHHSNGYAYSYFTQPGDTISINIVANIPFATSTNKKLKDMDLNAIANYGLTKLSHTKFENRALLENFLMSDKSSVKYDLQSEYIEMINSQEAYLDSLAKKNHISLNTLDFWKKEKPLSVLSAKHFIDGRKQEESLKSGSFLNDEMIESLTYLEFVNIYTYVQYGSKYKSNSNKVFDALLGDAVLPQKTKLNQLYVLLTAVGANATTEEFEPRKEKFLQFANDTVWNTFVAKIPHLRTVGSKEMVLYDQKMNQVNFRDVMDKHKGKVIYIDLWASWCAPCIASFPAGEVLRKEYKNKDIVFLYLAFNDQEKPWLEGVKKYKLDDENTKSYLIASPKADWLKEMDVKSIPRYIIYNKDGKLTHKTAPNPKSDDIREVLNKLLK